MYFGKHYDVYLFLGSIVAMLMMDKLGRKVLLLGSFLGMVKISFGMPIINVTFNLSIIRQENKV